jgi:TPR repeat protein
MTPEDIYYDLDAADARVKLLELAATGDHEAEFYLGHLADEQSPRDQAGALDWYKKAAAGGFLEAKHWMASFMYHGMGTAQDIEGAVAVFRECAAAGHDASRWKLGQHLLQFPEHHDEAIHWLQLAASHGHDGAIEILQKGGGRVA